MNSLERRIKIQTKDKPRLCKRCQAPCELKFNDGDPVWVCETEGCRLIQRMGAR